MSKFHLTADGPSECRAFIRPCPLGGEHFKDRSQAEAAYAKQFSWDSVREADYLYKTTPIGRWLLKLRDSDSAEEVVARDPELDHEVSASDALLIGQMMLNRRDRDPLDRTLRNELEVNRLIKRYHADADAKPASLPTRFSQDDVETVALLQELDSYRSGIKNMKSYVKFYLDQEPGAPEEIYEYGYQKGMEASRLLLEARLMRSNPDLDPEALAQRYNQHRESVFNVNAKSLDKDAEAASRFDKRERAARAAVTGAVLNQLKIIDTEKLLKLPKDQYAYEGFDSYLDDLKLESDQVGEFVSLYETKDGLRIPTTGEGGASFAIDERLFKLLER